MCCAGSKRRRAGRKSEAVRLYVARFHESVDLQDLKEWFSVYGRVKDAFVTFDKNNHRIAFVELADEEAARLAIGGLNGAFYAGLRLIVREAKANPRPVRGMVADGKVAAAGEAQEERD